MATPFLVAPQLVTYPHETEKDVFIESAHGDFQQGQ